MRINICLASDIAYSRFLAATMASVLKNSFSGNDLYFYILENNFSQEIKNKILELKKIRDFSISFINFDDSKICKIYERYNNLHHITKVVFYRLFISDLLKDIDKIIYLDCDVIVLSDLKEMFNENIENYYLAGIEDIGYYYVGKDFGLQTYENYINAGILLINLKMWRQENICLKFIDTLNRNRDMFYFGDQDVINFVCGNKIKLLDLSWNVQKSFFEISSLLYHPLRKYIRNARRKPKIIHYTTDKKPWNTYTPLQNKYFKYEKITPFSTNYNFIFKLKVFIAFLKFIFVDEIRFLISPIIKIYKHKNSIKMKIFNHFRFSIFKYK